MTHIDRLAAWWLPKWFKNQECNGCGITRRRKWPYRDTYWCDDCITNGPPKGRNSFHCDGCGELVGPGKARIVSHDWCLCGECLLNDDVRREFIATIERTARDE